MLLLLVDAPGIRMELSKPAAVALAVQGFVPALILGRLLSEARSLLPIVALLGLGVVVALCWARTMYLLWTRGGTPARVADRTILVVVAAGQLVQLGYGVLGIGTTDEVGALLAVGALPLLVIPIVALSRVLTSQHLLGR